VRLEFDESPRAEIRHGLMDQFELRDSDVYELPGLLDYTTLFGIASLPVAQLRDPTWTPMIPLGLDPESDLFALIRAGDVLVHHPYESFDAKRGAVHPGRGGRPGHDDHQDDRVSARRRHAIRAFADTRAENGKQVACLVELKARFDEERNLHWANELQKAGDHVIYGVRGLKTHTKARARRASRGATGSGATPTSVRNYHVKTARMYTDFGLFTCDPAITPRRGDPVPHLTGYSREPQFDQLLVAPLNMRERFIELIEREAANRRAGRPAAHRRQDQPARGPPVCEALAAASPGRRASRSRRARLLLPAARGCGWTENVRVRSVIGRFLEHGRLFHFANGHEDPLRWRVLHRLGGLDGPQPVASRRGSDAVTSRALRERCGSAAGAARGPAQCLGDAAGRQLPAAAGGRGCLGSRTRGFACDAHEADPCPAATLTAARRRDYVSGS